MCRCRLSVCKCQSSTEHAHWVPFMLLLLQTSTVILGSHVKMAESSSGENATNVRVGDYKIGKTIGKGNFAVVKLAKNVYTNSEVIRVAV